MHLHHQDRPGRLASLFRRGPQWTKIDGYRVEAITSEEPVWVRAGSTMLGDIIAPHIRIDGIVHGAAVANSVTITAGGQIWGDIYTAALQIEAGGAIYGWMSSIDAGQYEAIVSQGRVPAQPADKTTAAPPGSSAAAARDLTHMETLTRLRHEASTAKAALAELEHTFEKRLDDVAGETVARVVTLREELARTRSELATAQQQLAALTNNLRDSQTQIEQQTAALTTAETLRDEQTKTLDKLQTAYDSKRTAYDQLDATYRSLNANYLTAQQEIDHLGKKIDSLESALQNNLQHSAEQETALIRWQELAEDYQERIRELESRLENSNVEIEEQSLIVDMLRVQRDQFESEWEQVQEELTLLRERELEPLSKEELVNERKMVDNLRAAKAEIERLQTAVAELAHYEEQVLWYHAELETARAELQEARAAVGKQEIRLANLQAQLDDVQTNAEAQQADFKQLNEQLITQTERIHALEQQLDEEIKKGKADRTTARKSIQKLRLQVEGAEMELEQHLQETAVQGQHLAELQATLVEQDLEREQLRQTAADRGQAIIELKEAARKRVELLETKLATSQAQIQELQAFIERSHRKNRKE